jgi:hypothetical protein
MFDSKFMTAVCGYSRRDKHAASVQLSLTGHFAQPPPRALMLPCCPQGNSRKLCFSLPRNRYTQMTKHRHNMHAGVAPV